MRKVAVVGNRNGWKQRRVFEVLEQHNITNDGDDDMIISGGAIGVDTYAQEYAELHGIPILIYYPNNDIDSPKRYYERNGKIANDCDIMIAFDNNPGKTGTTNARHQAMDLQKRVIHILK